MNKTTTRIYLNSDSLSEIHEQMALATSLGWSQVGTLCYTHSDNGGSGWEAIYEMQIAIDQPDTFYDDFETPKFPFLDGYMIVLMALLAGFISFEVISAFTGL